MKLVDRAVIYVPLAAACGLILMFLHSTWPRVGFDLGYFLPRMVDVHLHYLANGPSIQWWTPSFGGGIPAFPNPQHTQFMFTQILLGLFNPWTANVVSLVSFLSLGYLLLVKFGQEYLGWSVAGAVVAALVFATNDFFLTHVFAGHVGFQTFPLVVVIPFCLHSRHRISAAAVLIALSASAILMSGGYAIIVVWWLTALILLTGLSLSDAKAFPLARGCAVLALGAGMMLLLCAAKLCAVALFMQQFPRIVSYSHPAPLALVAIASVPAQLFAPKLIWALDYLHLSSAEREYAKFIGVGVDDIGLSPIATILVPIGLGVWLRNIKWDSARLAIGLCIASVWIAVEFTTGRGCLWPSLKSLPFFRSLHENSRFAAAFVLPFSLFCGVGVEAGRRLLGRTTKQGLFAAGLIVVTIAGMFSFRRAMHGYWFSGFDLTETQSVWEMIRLGEDFIPIQKIADVRDDHVFSSRASSLNPYEPIFGYGFPGPEFHTQLKPGAVKVSTETPNVMHPVALYSPAAAGLAPFSRVPGNQSTNAEIFLSRRQPAAWRVPLLQTIANVVSLTTLLVVIVLSVWLFAGPTLRKLARRSTDVAN